MSTAGLPALALVTGFPDRYLATRVIRRLLEVHRSMRIRCIVRESRLGDANRLLASLSFQQRERLRLLVGDPAALDLGLSGTEFAQLAREVELIHHCASVVDPAASRERAADNLTMAREVLELADAASGLQRLVHWSSTIVSGAREGLVMEDELSETSGFRNPVEQALYRTETMMRESMNRASITVLRPATLVGDSVTGETDLLHGPYLLIRVLLSSPQDLRMPAPMRRDVRLSFVPIDYAVSAGIHISQDPRAVRHTYHIVDPKPVTLRRAFELFAESAGRPVPKGYVPASVASLILRAPGFDRWVHTSKTFLDNVRTAVIYDDRGARQLLDGSSIRCPALEDYVDAMVGYVRASLHAKQSHSPAGQPRPRA